MAPKTKSIISSKGASNKRSKLKKRKKAADDANNALNSKILRNAAKQAAKKALEKVEVPKPIEKYDKNDFFKWICSIPFSRKLRFLPKDFSDGVLVAEIVKYYEPTLVDLHNYLPSVGKKNKTLNWILLKRKVFSRYLKINVTPPMIELFVSPAPKDAIAELTGDKSKWYPIEKFLVDVREKLALKDKNLFRYREGPQCDMNNRPRPKREIRPLSRQEITDSMWRLERQSASKYGRYKGNPITWDDVPEYYEKATLLQMGVGISTEKFRRIQDYWIQRKLKEEANKQLSSSVDVDTSKSCQSLQSTSTCPLSHVTPNSLSNATSSNSTAKLVSTPASVSASSNCVSVPSKTQISNLPSPTMPKKKYRISCPVPCSIETDFPVSVLCSPDSTEVKIVSSLENPSSNLNMFEQST